MIGAPQGGSLSPRATSEPALGESRPPDIPQATGLRRWVYLSLGLLCLLLGVIGWIVPLLPGTPWVLAASFFFARSSPWFHRLLRRSPYFGHILRDWEAHRGVRPWVKATAVTCVTGFITLMAVFLDVAWWAKGCAIGLAAVGVGVILFAVPTVRPAVRSTVGVRFTPPLPAGEGVEAVARHQP